MVKITCKPSGFNGRYGRICGYENKNNSYSTIYIEPMYYIRFPLSFGPGYSVPFVRKDFRRTCILEIILKFLIPNWVFNEKR